MKRVFKPSDEQALKLAKLVVGRGNGTSVPTPKNPERSGKFRLKDKDMPTPEERALRDAPMTFSLETWPAMLERMKSDPNYEQDVLWHLRQKLQRSDPHRSGVAGRSAAREPMLNASPDSIKHGLDYREVQRSTRVAKGQLVNRIVVKPTSSKTARLGLNSSSWTERTWGIWTLRWAKGFVAVTDTNLETRVFPNIGQLKSAIRKSGWEIVRTV